MELKNNLQLFTINEYCQSMYGEENPLSTAVNDMLNQNDPSNVDLDVCSDILNSMCKNDSKLQMFVTEKVNTLDLKTDAQVLALAYAFDKNIGENDFSEAAIDILETGVVHPGTDEEIFNVEAFTDDLNEYLFWDAVNGDNNFKEAAEQVLNDRAVQNGSVDVKELAEKLIHRDDPENEPEQNYSPYQQRMINKINHQVNHSDKSLDFDI